MVVSLIALCVQYGSQSNTPGQSVGLTNVGTWKRGAVSQVREESLFVLNNERDFDKYWEKNQFGRPPKDIDWIKQMVVAVHLGQRPNAGYELELKNTELRNNVIWLHMRERTPMPNAITAQVVTSPWVLVRMDHTAWTVKTDFVKSQSFTNGVDATTGTAVYKFGNATVIVPGNTGGSADYGWTDYYSGYDCGYDTEGIVVFDSGDQLRNYWNRSLRLDERLAPSTIDWQNERVVAVHLGVKPMMGYQPVVVGVKSDGRNGVLLVKEVPPANLARARKVTTRPYTLVRVNRWVKNWKIEIQK